MNEIINATYEMPAWCYAIYLLCCATVCLMLVLSVIVDRFHREDKQAEKRKHDLPRGGIDITHSTMIPSKSQTHICGKARK